MDPIANLIALSVAILIVFIDHFIIKKKVKKYSQDTIVINIALTNCVLIFF